MLLLLFVVLSYTLTAIHYITAMRNGVQGLGVGLLGLVSETQRAILKPSEPCCEKEDRYRFSACPILAAVHCIGLCCSMVTKPLSQICDILTH